MYITTSKGASMMEDVQMFHDSHETFDLPFSFVQIVVLLELGEHVGAARRPSPGFRAFSVRARVTFRAKTEPRGLFEKPISNSRKFASLCFVTGFRVFLENKSVYDVTVRIKLILTSNAKPLRPKWIERLSRPKPMVATRLSAPALDTKSTRHGHRLHLGVLYRSRPPRARPTPPHGR